MNNLSERTKQMFTSAHAARPIRSQFNYEADRFTWMSISIVHCATPNTRWRHGAALQKVALNKIILITRFSVCDLSLCYLLSRADRVHAAYCEACATLS